jgi:hypothetical protein
MRAGPARLFSLLKLDDDSKKEREKTEGGKFEAKLLSDHQAPVRKIGAASCR